MSQRTAPQRLNPLSTSELRDLLENIYRHSVKYNIAISDDDSLVVYDNVNNLFYKCTAKELVESVTPIKELIDNLESTNGTTAALSANQGRVLAEWIIKNQDDLTEVISTLDSDLRDFIRDTATTLNDAIVENIATVNETIVDVNSRAQEGITGNTTAIQTMGAHMYMIDAKVIALDTSVTQNTITLDMYSTRIDNNSNSITDITNYVNTIDPRIKAIETETDAIRDISMATNNGSNDTDTAIVSYSNGRFKLNTPSTITPVIKPIIINDAPVTITLDGAFRLSPNDTVDVLLSILTDVSGAVLTCETYIETILSSGNILISDKHTTRHVFGEASIPDTLLLRRKCNSKASGAYGRQYIYVTFMSTVPITFNIMSTLAIPSKVSVNSNITLANNIYDSYKGSIEPDVNYRLQNQHDINADLRTAINDIAGGISAEGVVKYDDFKEPDNTVYYCVTSTRSGMNTYCIMDTTGTAYAKDIQANTDGAIIIRNHYKVINGTISNLSGMSLRMNLRIPEGKYTYVARTVANYNSVEHPDGDTKMLGMANGKFEHNPVNDNTDMLFHIPLNDDDSLLTHQIEYTGIELEVTLRIYGITPNAYTPFTILCSNEDSINIGFAKLKHITPANQVYDRFAGMDVNQSDINKGLKYLIDNVQPAEGGIKYTDYAESLNDVYYATGYSLEADTHIFELATSGDELDMTILTDNNKAIQFSMYGLGGGRISNMNIPTLTMCLADLGEGEYTYSSTSSLEYQATAGAEPITIPNFYNSLGVISHRVSSEDAGLVVNIPLHNDKTKYIPAITYHEYILTTRITITHPNKPIRYNIVSGGRQSRPLRVGWTAMDGISSASQVYDHFLESYIPQANINRYFQDNLTSIQSEDFIKSLFNSIDNTTFVNKVNRVYPSGFSNENLVSLNRDSSYGMIYRCTTTLYANTYTVSASIYNNNNMDPIRIRVLFKYGLEIVHRGEYINIAANISDRFVYTCTTTVSADRIEFECDMGGGSMSFVTGMDIANLKVELGSAPTAYIRAINDSIAKPSIYKHSWDDSLFRSPQIFDNSGGMTDDMAMRYVCYKVIKSELPILFDDELHEYYVSFAVTEWINEPTISKKYILALPLKDSLKSTYILYSGTSVAEWNTGVKQAVSRHKYVIPNTVHTNVKGTTVTLSIVSIYQRNQ